MSAGVISVKADRVFYTIENGLQLCCSYVSVLDALLFFLIDLIVKKGDAPNENNATCDVLCQTSVADSLESEGVS